MDSIANARMPLIDVLHVFIKHRAQKDIVVTTMSAAPGPATRVCGGPAAAAATSHTRATSGTSAAAV